MRQTIIPLFAVNCMLVLLIACQKETAYTAESFPKRVEVSSQEAKSPTMKTLLFSDSLDRLATYEQKNKSQDKIIRLIPYRKNKAIPLFRYRLVEKDNQENILSVSDLVSIQDLKPGIDLFSLNPKNKQVVCYDPALLNDRQINKTVKLVLKIAGKEYDLNTQLYRLPNCESRPPVCIDWYWTTYNEDTGEIISEIYLYTTCHDPCAGTGGGGGTNPVAEENCNAAESQLQSSMVSVTKSISLAQEDPTTRTGYFVWEFHRQHMGLWSFYSYEKATHIKEGKQWKWKSLVHEKISKSGVWLGGSVNCTVNTATAEVGIYNAGMKLAYTIDVSAICKGFPIGFSKNFFNTSPIWNVNAKME